MSFTKAVLGLMMGTVFGYGAWACTVFVASDGQTTLFGNNEDVPMLEEAVMRFVPASPGQYGRFYLSFPSFPDELIRDYPQGGMNEHGLAYDITATLLKDPQEFVIPEGSPICDGYLMDNVLAQAATVDEGIAIIRRCQGSGFVRRRFHSSEFVQMQVLLADPTGDSAVIGIGKDNRLSVIKTKRNFQVLTGFSLAHPENSLTPERERFDMAVGLLETMEDLSIGAIRRILSLVHYEGLAITLYSTIYDLEKRQVFLYNYHDYETVVRIDLEEALKKPEHVVSVPSLFSHQPFAWAAREQLMQYIEMLKEQGKDVQ